MTELEWNGDAVKRAVRRARSGSLFDGAGYIREQANRSVPIEEGTLQRSGGVDVDEDAGIAVVYYDTDYARVQHEDTTLRHDPGRRAKWLELTLREQRRQVRDILARGIGGVFR